MEKTTEIHKTLGQAIDELIQALEPLDESSRVTAIRATDCANETLLAAHAVEDIRAREPNPC